MQGDQWRSFEQYLSQKVSFTLTCWEFNCVFIDCHDCSLLETFYKKISSRIDLSNCSYYKYQPMLNCTVMQQAQLILIVLGLLLYSTSPTALLRFVKTTVS